MLKKIVTGMMSGIAVLAIPAMAQDMPHAEGHPAAADQRTAIVLNAAERAVILLEMRQFLTGVQAMTDGLARGDMKVVAQASGALGQKAAHAVPAPLKAKLPMEFKKLGFSVHSDFDQIAMDAESIEDAQHATAQLAGVLNKCVSCHGMYQIQSEPFPPLKK